MSKNSRREKPRKLRRHLRFESMESRRLLAADVFQHNFDMPDDVNGDYYVSPMDALAVINHLNSSSSHSSNISNALASGESAQSVAYLDVNDDGFVSPMDALSIINALNSSSSKTTSSKTAPATNVVTTEATSSTTATPTETSPANCDDADASAGSESIETTETTDDGAVTAVPVTTTPKATPPVTTPTSSTPEMTTPTTTTGTTAPTSSVPATTTTVSQLLVSTIQGTGMEFASVVFESRTVDGVAQSELEVLVRNSTSNSTLVVVINGVTVGSITTDDSGNGALELATVPKGTSELPLPADFPAVAAAATVLIGTTMTGMLEVPTGTSPCVNHEGHGEHENGSHHGGGSREAVETQFASVLTGTGSQLGYVQFESETHRGTLKSELGISVNSLTPNASLDVIIDGITVGQIVTDANGHGDLDLSSLPRGTNELPLPANFPVIAAGSPIQIGTELSGTFTASPNNPTLPTTTTPAAVPLQPQRQTSIGQGISYHRSRHR